MTVRELISKLEDLADQSLTVRIADREDFYVEVNTVRWSDAYDLEFHTEPKLSIGFIILTEEKED